MLAPFGKLIFDLYKAVSTAQTMFRNTQNPAIFKRQIINYILSENQIALLDQLDEQKILELARNEAIDFVKQYDINKYPALQTVTSLEMFTGLDI